MTTVSHRVPVQRSFRQQITGESLTRALNGGHETGVGADFAPLRAQPRETALRAQAGGLFAAVDGDLSAAAPDRA